MEKINYVSYGGENHEIDLKRLSEDFREAYEYFYENDGEKIPGYVGLVKFYDSHIPYFGDFRDLVKKFNELRGDFISSDREAAAFVAALANQI